MTPHFHPLHIQSVQPASDTAICIRFAVPAELLDDYRFVAGQFVTLKAQVHGMEQRRSYSICSTPQHYAATGEFSIAIKPIDGGVFSNWACSHLQPGNSIEVLPPDGRFHTPLDVAHHKHYLFVAAGSGITPVLSLVTSTLQAEPHSRVTLIYGNRSIASIMFCEELEDLKDRYLQRLTLYHVLSRQHQEVALFNGRIDGEKLAEILHTLVPASGIDEAFVCGPSSMIDEAEAALLQAGLRRAHVHAERFGTPSTAHRAAHSTPPEHGGAAQGNIQLAVTLDGKQHALRMHEHERVLDVALAAGLDLPYSCRAGVCCTCRAKVLEGRVGMERNYTLEPWEIDRGFVLTCQARPLTGRVCVSYDER